METGVRARKSARIKIDILDATTKLIGRKAFSELHVDEICDRVGVSKVTFFKYFPQKDDVLLYFLRAWCLKRAVELHQKPKEGLNGIYFLMDKLADTCEEQPGLWLSLISYMTSLNRPPAPYPLKTIERVMLFPDNPSIKDVELLSLNQMIDKFLLEAIFKNEIVGISDTKDISNLFLSVIYGSIMTAHIRQINSPRQYFKQNIDGLLKQLGH